MAGIPESFADSFAKSSCRASHACMANAQMKTSLSGQVAVVTGGGRGIGREIARQLAAAGATVVVTARTVPQLEETRGLILSEGGSCEAMPLDVLDEAAINRVFQEIEAVHGRIDLLVNNAGISGPTGLPWEGASPDWWRTLEVNLRGPYLCSKAVIPGMVQRKSGRIIMVGSNMAFWPYPSKSAYGCSKAALVRLGDNFAEALMDHGIAVFTISPGLVATDMTKEIPDEFTAQAEWTPVEKPAALCVALASGRADALSGRYIHASAHDLDELIARAAEIREKKLQTMRLVE
jgi:NAD(P)-dependent dehydrogenase (short-subunit alcohol dehydrogenase family)